MISIQSIALIALAYLFALFLIAYFGDSKQYQQRPFVSPNIVYALSLAVYCSSWTFYGAVGTAAQDGLDYLAIYFGPFLVFIAGYPVVRRIILICKQSNITSISDFISSRYDKSRRIGVVVTIIAVIGSLPYIALQLKAVSMTYTVLSGYADENTATASSVSADSVALYTGIILAVFAILFGTRHLDSTEHHRGMVLAIAFESIVKLAAILVVGYYAVYLLLDSGTHASFSQFVSSGSLAQTFTGSSTWASFATKTLLAMSAIVLLPRQFQVMVVESLDHRQFKTASWMMPIYFVLTSIIVIPIALAGSVLLPEGRGDLYVLTLPLTAGSELLSIFVFIGGLSAATGMVIVSVISLSTMVCNDLVMPNLIRSKSLDILNSEKLNEIILLIRRLAIVAMIGGAYGYYRLADNNANLANIGILSFAAIFQFVPAFVCSLFWRRAHSRGIFWGLIGGSCVWAYTLMLPTLLSPETVAQIWVQESWLHPQSLFGLGMDNPLTHGVIWSLAVNVFLIVFFSFKEEQSVLEKLQASRFFHTGGDLTTTEPAVNGADMISVHPDSLRILAERIIGPSNTQKVFSEYEKRMGCNLEGETQVDRKLLALVQTAIVGVIGASSAQKVISDTILGGEEYLEEGTAIVEEASSALQFNRNLLQTTLQNITHGIAVVDGDLNLVIWNDRYLDLFEYPENLIYVGKPIKEVLEYNARRGDFENKDGTGEVRKRLKYLTKKTGYQNIRTRPNGVVIKSVGEPMPGGGFVTTYEDITESVNASEQLRQANEELEDRVRERTKELEVLTEELEKNTRSKTHFLAAASHDLLQPINAARLFTHSILERSSHPEEVSRLADRVDKSLSSANHLLRALLDVSKLDAGGIQPEPSEFSLVDFVDGISREFEPSAQEKQIELSTQVPAVWIRTDRQLLLSVLQNFVTNAIRYTNSGGKVLIKVSVEDEIEEGGGEIAKISVVDNGIGIDPSDLDRVFNEFYRVKVGENEVRTGLGLGLSIVERISQLLNLSVSVDSKAGEGSEFSISVPIVEPALEALERESQAPLPTREGRLSGVEVLCVDNDLAVLEAMQTLLEGWGCAVTSVTSYRLGTEALNETNFDLVLADYRLDFIETGLDLLLSVKEHSGDKSIPGVLITAEQDEMLKDRAAELGFQYLAKPLEPAALKSLMLYLLSSKE